MNKQQYSALKMAKFIAEQALELHFKLDDLGLDEQIERCKTLHVQARALYQSLRSCIAKAELAEFTPPK